ncbi:MAG: ATP-binding protein [Lachnospiraceae bacterium]
MMINSETRRKLQELNLYEIISALEIQETQKVTQTLGFEERFQLIVDYTYQEKYANKVKRLTKGAHFRFPQASVDDVYYTERKLDRQKILGVATCQYLSTNTNIIFQGFTGSGKSFLACAIGIEACKQGYRTRYVRLPDLLQMHDEASITTDGVSKLIRKFSAYTLLIIDEWLLCNLTQVQEHFIFELIERRYTDGSTVFCTQYKLEDWHARLGGGIHADAIIDRIIHNKIQVYAGDINMREIYAKEL